MRIRRFVATASIATVSLGLIAAAADTKPKGKGKPKANVAVTEVGGAPAAVPAGNSFSVDVAVRNRGKADARKVRVDLILRGANDIAAGGDRFAVNAKSTARKTITGVVPASAAAGGYTLVACVPKPGKKGATKCRTGGQITVTTGGGNPPKQYTPGARTVGDPLFPQVGNGGYDARSYDLEFDYDPAANSFDSATTTMTAVATQDLSEFTLDFQMDAESVTVNGAPASFTQVEPGPELGTPATTQPLKLVVTPAAGIDSGTQMTVVVEYSGTPVRIVDADESSEGWIPACSTPNFTGTCDGAFVVNQPNGAQGWFPNNNTPTDKATFETHLTVPATHTAIGIGELVSRDDNGDGTETWNWSEDDPTSTYLTTATVGVFDYALNAMIEESTNRALPIYDFVDSSYPNATKLNVSTSLGDTPAILNYLSSELFGPYPLDSTGAVVGRTVGVGYALEVQTKPHFSQVGNASQDISTGTQVHELIHQWMGNTATAEQWTDLWFNEGWAEWGTWKWQFDNAGGDDPAAIFDDLYATTPEEDWEVAPAVLDGDPALMFFPDFPSYVRGGMVMQATLEILGEGGFETFIDRLMTDFRYGNISTQEFIALAGEVSGFSGSQLDLLNDFYDQWLYGETKPTLLPEDVTGAAVAATTSTPSRSEPPRSGSRGPTRP